MGGGGAGRRFALDPLEEVEDLLRRAGWRRSVTIAWGWRSAGSGERGDLGQWNKSLLDLVEKAPGQIVFG